MKPDTRETHYRRYLWASIAAFLINLFVVPLYYYPMGSKAHWSTEGTLLAVVAGVMGCYGFFAGPRRPLPLKLGTGLICVLSTTIGIFSVIQLIRFGHAS